jgi:hypothetical protein
MTMSSLHHTPSNSRGNNSRNQPSLKGSLQNESVKLEAQKEAPLDRNANEQHENDKFEGGKRALCEMDSYPMITDKFGSLLNSLMLNGSCGQKTEDAQVPSVPQLMSAQMGNLLAVASSAKYDENSTVHPLFVRGSCKWPGCDMVFEDFATFTK